MLGLKWPLKSQIIFYLPFFSHLLLNVNEGKRFKSLLIKHFNWLKYSHNCKLTTFAQMTSELPRPQHHGLCSLGSWQSMPSLFFFTVLCSWQNFSSKTDNQEWLASLISAELVFPPHTSSISLLKSLKVSCCLLQEVPPDLYFLSILFQSPWRFWYLSWGTSFFALLQ